MFQIENTISWFELHSYSKQVTLYDCVDSSKLFGATGVYSSSKKVWSSHVHITCTLGIFIFWSNSRRVPVLSSCFTWAVLLQCIFWLKQMSERIPAHSHKGHPGMRSTVCGDHKRFASKAHSSCKLEHDGIIPFKCHAKKNGSLLFWKTATTEKGLFIAGKALLLS